MADCQFPPSSPVLNATSDDFVSSKGVALPRGRHDYPTPNPSSTTGRSSSPARHGELEGFGKHDPRKVTFSCPTKSVSINKDFNILNPHTLVLRVPLVAYRRELRVGRSSKSCDFSFKSVDKSVSRVHVKVDYSDDEMTLSCLGANGFGMIVPQVCQVQQVDTKAFSLLVAAAPLQSVQMPKLVRLDAQHTEFHVNKGESVQMPRFANVMLQVGKSAALVNPDDHEEELTEDEDIRAPLEFTPQTVVATAAPSTPQKPRQGECAEQPTPSKCQNSAFGQDSHILAPIAGAGTRKIEVEVTTPSATHVPFKRALTPLSNRSMNKPDTPISKRRAASEEPESKRKAGAGDIESKRLRTEPKALDSVKHCKRDANGKLIQEPKCIATLKNVEEIRNILINHLAFSRLSLTPASILNTISAAVSALSFKQLQTILLGSACIGVIYREGKDAAGKPLEEEYYYIPEKDADEDRTKLVLLLKGHGGLRSCRRTHKQYYWKKPAPIRK